MSCVLLILVFLVMMSVVLCFVVVCCSACEMSLSFFLWLRIGFFVLSGVFMVGPLVSLLVSVSVFFFGCRSSLDSLLRRFRSCCVVVIWLLFLSVLCMSVWCVFFVVGFVVSSFF